MKVLFSERQRCFIHAKRIHKINFFSRYFWKKRRDTSLVIVCNLATKLLAFSGLRCAIDNTC